MTKELKPFVGVFLTKGQNNALNCLPLGLLEPLDNEFCNADLGYLETELNRQCKKQWQNLETVHNVVLQVENSTNFISDLLKKNSIPDTCPELVQEFKRNHYHALESQKNVSEEFKLCIKRERELVERLKKTEELKFGVDAKKQQEQKVRSLVKKGKNIFGNISRIDVVNVEAQADVFVVTVIFEEKIEYPVKFVINNLENQVIGFDAGSFLTPTQENLLKTKCDIFNDISTVVCILRKIILKKTSFL